MKRIEVEVLKKGRKYFEVKYLDDKSYPFKLVINSVSECLKVGQKAAMFCEFETSYWKGHQKSIATPLTNEQIKEARGQQRQEEITKWKGYTESAFREGKIYQKGLDKLKELGFDVSVFNEKIVETQEAIRQADIRKWKGYVNNAFADGYVYHKGFKKLKELGFDTSIFDEKIEALEEIKNPAPDPNKISWSADCNYGRHKIGDVVEYQGQWVRITHAVAREFDDDDEDAYCLGFGPGTTMHYSAISASHEEEAVATKIKEEKERKQQEKKEILWDILDLEHLFKTTGKHIHREPIKGAIYLSNSTDYTELSWFDIAEDGIWYCQYNGGDGHCWSETNVTFPYRAIGMRLDYSPELEDRIKKADQYIKSNNISLHHAIKHERTPHYQNRNTLVSH